MAPACHSALACPVLPTTRASPPWGLLCIHWVAHRRAADQMERRWLAIQARHTTIHAQRRQEGPRWWHCPRATGAIKLQVNPAIASLEHLSLQLLLLLMWELIPWRHIAKLKMCGQRLNQLGRSPKRMYALCIQRSSPRIDLCGARRRMRAVQHHHWGVTIQEAFLS